MANPYFTAAPLTVYDGDIAKASDLNNLSVAVETAFDLGDQILQTIVTDMTVIKAAADADVVLTHADVVLTHADVVLTHADVVLTHADVVLTHADVTATALDKIATNADVVSTGLDKIATNADVISAAASASAAAASYDNFDDRYLGAKAADPTLDNDGAALLTGALYWNTVVPEMRVYSGTVWTNTTNTAIVGPVSAVDGEVVLFDGTTGKLAKGGGEYISSKTHAATSKTTPIDADEFPLVDSADTFGLKKYTWGNIKTTLETYFNTKYASLTGLVTQVFSVATATSGSHAARAESLNGRNLIVNGSCQISSKFGGNLVTPANGDYVLDNNQIANTQTGKLQSQQRTDVLTSLGVSHALTISVLAQYSPLATDAFIIRPAIEGINFVHLQWGTANAKPVSLQFKTTASIAGTYSGSLRNAAGTRSYPFSFTLAANTPTTVKIENIPGETSGVWPTGEVSSAYLFLDLGSGSNYKTTAGAWANGSYFGVTGAVSLVSQVAGSTLSFSDLQLESGPVCTQFERKLRSQVALECQRYHPTYDPEKASIGFYPCQAYSTTKAIGRINFSVPTRVAPTGILISDPSDFYVTSASSTGILCSALINQGADKYGGAVDITVASGLVAGNVTLLYTQSSVARIWWTGAEL